MENKMGGIISVEYVPSDGFSSFSVLFGRCRYTLASGVAWRNLCLQYMKGEVSDSPSISEDGHLSDYAIRLPFYASDERDSHLLSLVFLQGCVMRVRFADGSARIYGVPGYPVTGTISDSSGTQPSETRCLILNASCSMPCMPDL